MSITFSYQQSNNPKVLEVYNVVNSRILVKYKGIPMYISFTDLRNGKTRIHINDIDDEEGSFNNKENTLDLSNYDEDNDIKSSTNSTFQMTMNKKNENNSKTIFIVLIVFIIVAIIITFLCWYFYKKRNELRKKLKTSEKKESNINKSITSSTISLTENDDTLDNSTTSNSTALTFPTSKSETSYSSSSTYYVPKLESINIPENKSTDDTSTLVSMKTLSGHKNLSVKSISTIVNALAFFALETTEQETKNKTIKNVNLQSTQMPSEMLTEQYLKSSVPNSRIKIKSSPLKSNISHILNTGTYKIDETQESEEEKNSRSDPSENGSSSSIKSSKIGSVSSIHHSDLSTQTSK